MQKKQYYFYAKPNSNPNYKPNLNPILPTLTLASPPARTAD